MERQPERRFTSGGPSGRVRVERRVGTEPPYVTGIAAPFWRAGDPGTEFRLYDDLVERVLPTAFDRACRECDVRGLFNHDVGFLLGRTGAQTMALMVDDTGLRYRIKMPNTQAGRDVMELIRRGDVTGSSFSFLPYPDGVRMSREGKMYVRELTSVQLFDVGPVCFPAYSGSSAQAGTAGAAGAAAQANSARGLSTLDLVALVEQARRGLPRDIVREVKEARRSVKAMRKFFKRRGG
jgi:HK97 family phage prohead protease